MSQKVFHVDIILGEMHLEYGTPIRRRLVHIIGNISLKNFDAFQFRL